MSLLARCEELADSVLDHRGRTRLPSSRHELAQALRELVDAVEVLVPFITDGRWEADAALEHHADFLAEESAE